MSLVIVGENLSKEDIKNSREDYPEYIKITADLKQEIVVIGGEYHADAENILVEKFDSKRSNVWGGGYNITTKLFEINAMLNLKPTVNDSLDILDPQTRTRFLEIVKSKLVDIESLI
jgi:hypothetical protein